jgi:hypothetical protein
VTRKKFAFFLFFFFDATPRGARWSLFVAGEPEKNFAKKGKRVFYFGKTRGGRQKTDRGKNTKEEKTTEIGPAKKRECFSSQKEGITEITMFATTTSTKTNSFSSRLSSSLRKPRSSAKKSINATVRVLYVSSPKPKI